MDIAMTQHSQSEVNIESVLNVSGEDMSISRLQSYSIRPPCVQTVLIRSNVSTLKRSVDDLDMVMLPPYLLTCLLGTVGNAFVIYVILNFRRCPQRKVALASVTNDYILNLSTADLIFVLTLPFFCYATVMSDWPFGEAACRLTYAVRETNCYASVYTLVALSVDRYLASSANNNGSTDFRTTRVARIVCGVIWLVCGLLTTPYFLYATVLDKKQPSTPNNGVGTTLLCHESSRRQCRFAWPGDQVNYKIAWTCFQLTFALVAPFTIIFTSYALLARRLCTRLDRQGGSTLLRRPCRQTTRTVVVIGVTFLICYVPYHVVRVMALRNMLTAREHGPGYLPPESEYRTFVYLNSVGQVLIFVASCCNPIIYGLLNATYRKQYLLVLCWCRGGANTGTAQERRGLTGASMADERHPQGSCHMTAPQVDERKPNMADGSVSTRSSSTVTPPTELLSHDHSPASCMSTWV